MKFHSNIHISNKRLNRPYKTDFNKNRNNKCLDTREPLRVALLLQRAQLQNAVTLFHVLLSITSQAANKLFPLQPTKLKVNYSFHHSAYTQITCKLIRPVSQRTSRSIRQLFRRPHKSRIYNTGSRYVATERRANEARNREIRLREVTRA